MLLNKQIWIAVVSVMTISVMAACARNSEQKQSSSNDLSSSSSSKENREETGLASADNRKAIIAELGKNYQKSANGQYRKRIATIAPFKIQLVNGQEFTYKDLEHDKPVILVYFSPDCQECQQFTKSLVKRIADFKDRQLLFVTYQPLDKVTAFYNENGLRKYPQLKMGTEGYSFTVQKYYKVEHFPFVASYDKTGHLVQVYVNNTQPEKLAAEI
ncbi:redoxin domain-containing protein [Arachidicoccus ginsenosidivorans]|jgi:hypothetical protein|uniref:Redoxin domain-containing protein n=1 Tax=Arachidicoccus ginsenosidivorans TaxID=496057 RepID=A0A5B8VR23_9BACT|nr:redoxin domain-containing protein [Arachidicoccus ginsenosidivorans]QEC72718.1 redoxin domain-containing protein [Arachidicoccus ginsenosidivorans]